MYKISSSLHFVKTAQSASARDPFSEDHWMPNTDVYATDSGVVIKVELSGMRKEDLEITVEGNRLKIGGHRPDGCRAPKCNFHVMEINYGSFERIIELPEGYDLGQALAAYQNGFLRIDVPALSKTQKTIARVLVKDREH